MPPQCAYYKDLPDGFRKWGSKFVYRITESGLWVPVSGLHMGESCIATDVPGWPGFTVGGFGETFASSMVGGEFWKKGTITVSHG